MSRAQAFGRYDLLDRVSAGGMAEVFRALDTTRNVVVALKRILPQVAEDEDFIAMFVDEARIASQLEHPHIARTIDFGHVDGEYFIAFEYVDGKDLRMLYDRCAKDQQPAALAVLLYVFARIGEGLSYAHSRKDPESGEPTSLVHRDVSPQNIVISFTGDVKLIDFGIAKAANKVTRTQAGTIKGKFGYMSPEQVRGVPIDHRADIFALGICMWELLTQKRLFSAENELLVLDRIRNLVVVPPSTHNSQVSPELDRIVLKALAKDQNERYRAAKDLYRDINALPESTGTREDVAEFMRSVFPEAASQVRNAGSEIARVQGHASSEGYRAGASPAGLQANMSSRQQETRAMAAENKSDLDIFEGLGKKSAGRDSKSGGVVPPQPPRSNSSSSSLPDLAPQGSLGMQPQGDVAGNKKTLLGLQGVPAGLSGNNNPTVAGGSRPAPPPPPGRGQLPQVVPPPPKMGSNAPPVMARNGNGTNGNGSNGNGHGHGALDMDWDDEDEATHVFDKGESQAKIVAVPAFDSSPPSGAAPARARVLTGNPLSAPPPPPPPPQPSQPSFRASSPPLPPPSTPPFRTGAVTGSHPPFRTPLPPPPSNGSFARGSSASSNPPGPISYGNSNGLNVTSPMRMPSSIPPGPGGTAPMPMPGNNLSTTRSTNAPATSARSIEATALVRPQPGSRTGLWVGLGLVFTAIVAGAVYVTTPKTGKVVVNVTDEKGLALNRVEIFIDGKKMCDTAPCSIEPVSAGAHEVKVISEGFDVPPSRSTSVEARKEAALSFALTAAASSKAGTGIKVSGGQSGVKLLIDDREVGPLPQEVRDLAAGTHKVKLMGSDRYAALEKNITVAQNEVLDLGLQQLKVVKGKATIQLGTPGAKVYIVSGSDRHEVPTFPISIDIDTSKQWWLEATKPTFADYKLPVSFDDGQAEKSFTVTLEPKAQAVAVAPPPQAPAPQAPVAPPPVAAAPRPAAPKPAPAAPAAPAAADPESGAAASGEGFLDINSMPTSSVVLDGKPIGNTPKIHISVPAGNHTVLFINAEQGLKKSMNVSVAAGESKKAIAKLRD